MLCMCRFSSVRLKRPGIGEPIYTLKRDFLCIFFVHKKSRFLLSITKNSMYQSEFFRNTSSMFKKLLFIICLRKKSKRKDMVL